jgi:GTPase
MSDTPPEAETAPTRAGYVALIGYPNAGKSSLLNRLLDQKLSIVTPLPQTTRERVVGIDTRDGVQMVFLDTPGLVEPRYLLHSSMLHAALQAAGEADVVLVIVDPLAKLPDVDVDPFPRLRSRAERVVVVVNKTDAARPEQVDRARRWAEEAGFTGLMTISALTGEGTEQLRSRVAEMLPESPFFFPEDELATQSTRFFVEEFVRESAFELYKEEVPYSLAVKIEEFREGSTPLYIRATLFVERASQKGILIGAGGSGIRRLGEVSRHKIEEFLGTAVYLDLWIKVLPKWRKEAGTLRHLGFQLPSDSHG